jgi:hypothetical protein
LVKSKTIVDSQTANFQDARSCYFIIPAITTLVVTVGIPLLQFPTPSLKVHFVDLSETIAVGADTQIHSLVTVNMPAANPVIILVLEEPENLLD